MKNYIVQQEDVRCDLLLVLLLCSKIPTGFFFLTFLVTFAPVARKAKGKLALDFSNLSNFEPAFVLLMLGVSEIRDSTVLSEKFSLIVVTFVMRKLLLFAHWCTISYQLFRCGCFCTYDLFSLFFL